MKSLEHTTSSIDKFFQEEQRPSMQKFAQIGAEVINTASISTILEEALKDSNQIQAIGDASYRISPNFLKLFLHRDQETRWGLRVHVFTPNDSSGTLPLDEPWHEHRWNLASSVLKGAIHSENAFTNLDTDMPPSPNEMYYYSVPDKQKIGKIMPRLLGKCTLDHVFKVTSREGTTYAHHSLLAHHLTLFPQDGTTITSVVTAPPNRTEAAFIEPTPLEFEERDNPKALSVEATREAIQLILDELQSESSVIKQPIDPNNPFPDYLYQT